MLKKIDINDCLKNVSVQCLQYNWKWIGLKTRERQRAWGCLAPSSRAAGLCVTTSGSCQMAPTPVRHYSASTGAVAVPDGAEGLSLLTFHLPVWTLVLVTRFGSGSWRIPEHLWYVKGRHHYTQGRGTSESPFQTQHFYFLLFGDFC